MALLGAQLVITLAMVSVIQKLSPHFSLAQWLLCSTGLMRYIHPSDYELKTLAGIPKSINKPKKSKRHFVSDEPAETFKIPRSLDIQLEMLKISPVDVMQLRFYSEYQWLVDFSLYAAIVYILSELYHFVFPLKEEINLSMMWCLLVIYFTFKLLISLTLQYFRSDESIGERSTCIVTGFTYLLIAMIILIIDENTLETGIQEAYRSFNHSASKFLENQGLNSSGPASRIVLQFFIAIICGLLGALFTFPGLRMARMHWDSLKYCKENRLLRILLNVSFALPFILVILWIRPISREFLTEREFYSNEKPFMSTNAFETMRLLLVIITVVMKLALMPVYLQSYLNLAYERVEEQKKESGKISNQEYKRNIASIFYYLCVVTLQYVAPILMCLYLTLMYKTLGGYTWTGFLRSGNQTEKCGLTEELEATILPSTHNGDLIRSGFVETIGDEVQDSWSSLKSIFTIEVYRGLFGFATWWSCFIWFATTSVGMLYQSYFTKW